MVFQANKVEIDAAPGKTVSELCLNDDLQGSKYVQNGVIVSGYNYLRWFHLNYFVFDAFINGYLFS